MTEQQPVPFEQKGITPLDKNTFSFAIMEGDMSVVMTMQRALRQVPEEQEIMVYSQGIIDVYEHFTSGRITHNQFQKRLNAVISVDTTIVDEDGEVYTPDPRQQKRKHDTEKVAGHGQILKTIKQGLRRNYSVWEKIVSTMSTNQLEEIGRPDLFICSPQRISEYLSRSVHKFIDGDRSTTDMNLIIQTIFERDDDDGDEYLEAVRESLKERQPAAYKFLMYLAIKEDIDWIVDFLSEEAVDHYRYRREYEEEEYE